LIASSGSGSAQACGRNVPSEHPAQTYKYGLPAGHSEHLQELIGKGTFPMPVANRRLSGKYLTVSAHPWTAMFRMRLAISTNVATTSTKRSAACPLVAEDSGHGASRTVPRHHVRRITDVPAFTVSNSRA
jgi:hypothetical protein